MLDAPLLSTHFPYCIKRAPNKKYILLNREYRPIGCPLYKDMGSLKGTFETQGQDPLFYFDIKRLTPRVIAKLHCKREISKDYIPLYDDQSYPLDSLAKWKRYAEKLFIIAKLVAPYQDPDPMLSTLGKGAKYYK
jgi:hypothetical protein